jgi:Trypsin-like peptidase domain
MPNEDIQVNFESSIAEGASADADAAPESPAVIGDFFMVDVPTEEVYFVHFDVEEMKALGDLFSPTEAEEVQEADGDSEPPGHAIQATPSGASSADRGDLAAEIRPQQLSVRSQLPLGDVGLHPWRTMGTKVPNGNTRTPLCTGTLVGSRSILTAAHCIVDYGQGNYQQFYTTNSYGWIMGRNGAETCYYQSTINKMFVPAQVVQPGQASYFWYAYDYAIVHITSPPQAISTCAPASSMARQSLDDATMDMYAYIHDGYPYCSDTYAPPGCVPYGHYKSLPTLTATDAANIVNEDGLATVRKHDGIASTRHSGGPLWNYWNGTTPTLVGTHIGGGNQTGFTNIFRRITPTSSNQIKTWQCLAGPCI